MQYLLWALAGWCGTPYPWWRWIKWPLPPTPPDPDPEPWWLSKLVALGAGVGGGLLTNQLLGGNPAATNLLTTLAGAFVVGRVAGEIVSATLSNRRAAAPTAVKR
jgi:hypothetical protein